MASFHSQANKENVAPDGKLLPSISPIEKSGLCLGLGPKIGAASSNHFPVPNPRSSCFLSTNVESPFRVPLSDITPSKKGAQSLLATPSMTTPSRGKLDPITSSSSSPGLGLISSLSRLDVSSPLPSSSSPFYSLSVPQLASVKGRNTQLSPLPMSSAVPAVTPPSFTTASSLNKAESPEEDEQPKTLLPGSCDDFKGPGREEMRGTGKAKLPLPEPRFKPSNLKLVR